MTVSNLNLSAPGLRKNELFLSNTMGVPLEILNSLDVSTGGELQIANSTLLVDGNNSSFDIDGTMLISTSTVIGSNLLARPQSSPTASKEVVSSKGQVPARFG
jgi:hypothetical protein